MAGPYIRSLTSCGWHGDGSSLRSIITANEVRKEARCGSCVKAGDYEGLAKLMKLYIENPADYQICGPNAREYFKRHFTLDIYMDSLEKELESMARKK